MKTTEVITNVTLASFLTLGLAVTSGVAFAKGSPHPANGTSGPYTAYTFGSPHPANGTAGPYMAKASPHPANGTAGPYTV